MNEKLSSENGLDFEFEGEPFDKIEKSKTSEEISREIFSSLKQDLEKSEIQEKIIDIPIIEQSGGTDCTISCLRMALAYFVPDHKDEGLNNFLENSKNKFGVEFSQVKGIYGEMGAYGNPQLVQSFIEKTNTEFGLEIKNIFKKEHYNDLLKALICNQPIIMGIDFHTLHPEYERGITRSHAILVKGYRINRDGNIVIVANDPKPKVGGEIELTEKQFTDAIEKKSMQIIFKK